MGACVDARLDLFLGSSLLRRALVLTGTPEAVLLLPCVVSSAEDL